MAPTDLEEGLGRLIEARVGEIFIAHTFSDGHRSMLSGGSSKRSGAAKRFLIRQPKT